MDTIEKAKNHTPCQEWNTGHPATHLHKVIEVRDLPVDPLLRESGGSEQVCWSAATVVAEIWWSEAQDPCEDLVTCL